MSRDVERKIHGSHTLRIAGQVNLSALTESTFMEPFRSSGDDTDVEPDEIRQEGNRPAIFVCECERINAQVVRKTAISCEIDGKLASRWQIAMEV